MGEVIKYPFEILKEYIHKEGHDFEYGSEKYTHVEMTDESHSEDGAYYEFIYKRESDGKYFRTSSFYRRYGYEDYGLLNSDNECELIEVEKIEITTYKWQRV